MNLGLIIAKKAVVRRIYCVYPQRWPVCLADASRLVGSGKIFFNLLKLANKADLEGRRGILAHLTGIWPVQYLSDKHVFLVLFASCPDHSGKTGTPIRFFHCFFGQSVFGKNSTAQSG
ncbi:hypothetical protein [Geoalkalibacter sp.]|uniref:hypothetical protein n=1 Tax=Geoalkalibacter sp. TaxID=3041440 RepID=UPI00272DEFD9|nr:hypothetical protein [Geoalkalibacter sp.]